jgi:hypothetical protein
MFAYPEISLFCNAQQFSKSRFRLVLLAVNVWLGGYATSVFIFSDGAGGSPRSAASRPPGAWRAIGGQRARESWSRHWFASSPILNLNRSLDSSPHDHICGLYSPADRYPLAQNDTLRADPVIVLDR